MFVPISFRGIRSLLNFLLLFGESGRGGIVAGYVMGEDSILVAILGGDDGTGVSKICLPCRLVFVGVS